MSKPGVMFYFDVRPCIKRLNLNEKGQLFEAILDYAESGIEPELDGALGIAWDFIQPRLDQDTERYGNKVLQKQYAAFVRELKKRGSVVISFDEWKNMTAVERDQLISGDIGRYPTSTSTPTSTPTSNSREVYASSPPRASRFTPPSVEEVRVYCAERKNSVDPERFVDFYASKGWLVGKSKMKDWRAAVRSWERSDSQQKMTNKDRIRSYDADESFV
jgi:hypothetical protein|nr:MAG TPA: hypothetical protein [Caudoviricetes sp.]